MHIAPITTNLTTMRKSSFQGGFLTDEEIMRRAPSVFAEGAHETRSARYAFIDSRDLLGRLRNEGFEPVFAAQSRTRDVTQVGFTKHMVRFRRSDVEVTSTGQIVPELVMVNSHGGQSSYHLMAGLFRVICLNGLIACEQQYASVRVPHTGNVADKVIEGAYTVLSDSTRALDAANTWQGVTLSRDEQLILARAAYTARFADHEGNVTTPIEPDQLLRVRRRDDDNSSLWTTFNRVQENVIRGGLRGTRIEEDGRTRRVSSRAVNGIDQNVTLNRALWQLTAEMAKLKGAA